MKRLHIELNDTLYLELVDAAAECYQPDEARVTPEEFAKEVIESALAARRNDRMSIYA